MIDITLLEGLSSIDSISGKFPRGKFNLCTDSREFKKGDLFWALRGEKFDGSVYVPEVLKLGCPIVVFEGKQNKDELVNEWKKVSPQTCFISTADTTKLLQEFARAIKIQWSSAKAGRRLIGITGSNGKTTTKEMLFHFLTAALPDKVLCTEKNLNNHIGVPKTLFRLNESIEVAVLEMGMSHPGEIQVLCDTALPDAGIITNIGPAHIEFFGKIEGIYQEKKSLFDAVMKQTQEQGAFVVNIDDEFLKLLPRHKHVITFSEKNKEANFHLEINTKESTVNISGKKKFSLSNKQITGKHNFINLATTFLMAYELYPEKEAGLVEAARNFRPKDNRSMWVDLPQGARLFMDAYNANPGSMEASLKGFRDYCQVHQIAEAEQFYILGDMNELGSHAEEGHRSIGQLVQKLKVENVAFVGRYRAFYEQGHLAPHLAVASTDEFLKNHWGKISKQFKFIFLKGSRSLQLEKLLDI